MERVQLEKLFQKYLKRNPSEPEIKVHGEKNEDDFEKELENCNEYKLLKKVEPLEINKNVEIKIAIASTLNYFEKTLPILLPSLLESGVKNSDINVFISGCKRELKCKHNGMNYYYLNYNSFEYSPLIYIVENELKSQYWFMLQDTCRAGRRFCQLLYQIPSSLPEVISLKKSPAMSIGSYKYSYLQSKKQKLLDIKNYDLSEASIQKWKAWGVPNEDYLAKMCPGRVVYKGLNWRVESENKNWYGDSIHRRVEYYPSLDLYKSKANWGQTNGKQMVVGL